MKKYYILFLCIAFYSVLLTSCKKYLDKAPESNFSEQEVFSNYNNFKLFFDAVYNGKPGNQGVTRINNYNIAVAFNFNMAASPKKFSLDQITDLCDGGRLNSRNTIKAGTLGSTVSWFYGGGNDDRYELTTSFLIIRTCNIGLQNIGALKDVKQEEIDDLIGQMHFIRAFAHFNLFRFWGPMPYISKVIGPYDDWDIPRLSKHETCMSIVADLDTSATYFEKANRMRRDNPVVGGVGHLNHPDQFRPNGVTAKALKGRVLLYAASPLNNQLGVSEWEEAAKANWDAIQVAQQYGYFLLSAADYKLNFAGTNYSDEELWGWAIGPLAYNSDYASFLVNGVFAASTGNMSGDNPTQNTVDKFETKWGDPLDTQAARDAATALGHYKEQDPYKNLDPRFYIDIIYNGAAIPGYVTAAIYYQVNGSGVISYSELLNHSYAGISNTGYYQRKLWGGQSTKNRVSPLHTDPIIRLAELYLNYAEAANEAYGPNTPAPGASLTAVQAVNLIRSRIGQPDVLPKFTDTKENFRTRIKNERTVELCFEGNYYFDIRRWMDAPVTMKGPLIGMNIEKVSVSPTYPIGFKHTRVALPANRQSNWKDEMYYIPFKSEDYFKMKNFDTSLNPQW